MRKLAINTGDYYKKVILQVTVILVNNLLFLGAVIPSSAKSEGSFLQGSSIWLLDDGILSLMEQVTQQKCLVTGILR